VLIFSLANVKKNAYLLPVMPAMVLVTVQGLQLIVASRRLKRLAKLADSLVVIQWLIGLGLAVAVPILAAIAAREAHQLHILVPVILGVILLAAAAVPIGLYQRRGPMMWLIGQGLVYTLLVVAFEHAWLYPDDNLRSAKPVAAQVEALLKQPGTTLEPQTLPEEASIYLPLDLRFDPSAAHLLKIVDDRRGEVTPANAFGKNPPAGIIRQLNLPPVRGSDRWKVFQLELPGH
jgi:4-amino-4-deoxy-L-arabinose transferase-like glycosyltransferase